MALRDIALTVEERDTHQFFWVLIEATDNDALEAIHYQRIDTATTPQPSYASALVLGVVAMRRLVDPQHQAAPGA